MTLWLYLIGAGMACMIFHDSWRDMKDDYQRRPFISGLTLVCWPVVIPTSWMLAAGSLWQKRQDKKEGS